MLMPQAEDLTRLPKRKADSNKGTYGKVLVIAGSEEMSGAAYFFGKGGISKRLRTGQSLYT